MATGDRNYDIAKETTLGDIREMLSSIIQDISRVGYWYATPGSDVTLTSYNVVTNLSYTSYDWDKAKELFTVTVPANGIYQVDVTMTNPNSSTASGRVYVGFNKNNYTAVAVSSIEGKGTASATGDTMYLRQGEKITVKCEGASNGSATLKDVTIRYNKTFA